MKTWVFEKAERIYNEGGVSFQYETPHGTGVFIVSDVDEDENYFVDVGEWLDTQCSCVFGVSHGVKGRKCPHEVAVFLYLVNEDVPCRRGVVERMEGVERNELSSTQKAKLRDILDCELCGSSSNIQLHRITRGGGYRLSNLMALCKKCHKLVHYKEEGHRKK